VNIQNNDGNTALTVAASNGHLSCVEYLASHGADANLQKIDDIPFLIWAAPNSHLFLAQVPC